MARHPRLATVLLLIFACFGSGWSLRAELTHGQIVDAKLATGYIITPAGTGTAFCISESGLFVTCNHVLPGVDKAKIEIVLDSAGETEKRYLCKVVRRAKEDDLAVVQVDLDRKVPALALGEVGKLFETQQVAAFGYPLGKALAADDKSYPSISVNFGRISALRRKKGVLEAIQLDAQVNPGNSGGPLLDTEGKVVGIIQSGVLATGINFAVPVTRLAALLETPVITVESAKIQSEQLAQPVEFVIGLATLGQASPETKVSLQLKGAGEPRQVAAVQGADGKYRAKIVPDPAAVQPAKLKLRVVLEFANGKVSGSVDDFTVAASGKPALLSTYRVLQRANGQVIFSADGQPVGEMPELQALKLDLGDCAVTLDARKATRIEMQKPSVDIPSITYRAIVKIGDKEFSSEEKSLTVHGPEIAGATILEGKVELDAAREIPLPGTLDDVVAAQDGRTLLIHFKELKKIAVFDVLGLKIRGYIDVGESRILFAGGSRYVLVAKLDAQVIERYSLETLERDRVASLPFANPSYLVMGCSSPAMALLVEGGSSSRACAFDAGRMALGPEARGNGMERIDGRSIIRASADGHTFASERIGLSPSGFIILTFRDNAFESFYEHTSFGVLVPNADGTQIFTSMFGIYTNRAVPILRTTGNYSEGTTYLPSFHPRYFLGVPYGDHSSREREANKEKPSLGIYLSGTSEPLVRIAEDLRAIAGERTIGSRNESPMTLDKRYWFYPQAGLLLTIPASNDKIRARPVDVRQLLNEKGIDYLYVTSIPPAVKVSSPYHFQLEAMSKAGGVRYALQSGPKGLTISPDGVVDWTASAMPGDETVIVTLKDSSGQETLHTFHIAVVE